MITRTHRVQDGSGEECPVLKNLAAPCLKTGLLGAERLEKHVRKLAASWGQASQSHTQQSGQGLQHQPGLKPILMIIVAMVTLIPSQLRVVSQLKAPHTANQESCITLALNNPI